MTEDIYVDGSAELGDDFSLASGIDEIFYDDPFDSHHDKSDGIGIDLKKCEYSTMCDSSINSKNHEMSNLRKLPPQITSEKKNSSYLDSCLLKNSSNELKIRQSTTNCNQHIWLKKPHRHSTLQVGNEYIKSVPKTKPSKNKKQSSYAIPKQEIMAVKARLSTKNMMKASKSDGLLTFALKAKYRKSIPSEIISVRNKTISSSSKRYSSPHIGELGINDDLIPGKVNDSWDDTSTSHVQAHPGIVRNSDFRRYSLPPVKSSGMHDLLLQSKAQCRSLFILRQSSAHSLSKRNSFQSIKFVNEKLDVSSLLPAKRHAKSKSASRRWSFPNVASATTDTESTKNLMGSNKNSAQPSRNGSIGDMTDSLLHEACRLFPNSDTVVETALRVDPDAVRRPQMFTRDQAIDSHQKTNNSMCGYPINLALTHGANERVLRLLAQSGSDVLAFKDGINSSASLAIALSSKHCSLQTVNILLSANQRCAEIPDRRGNYPLHIAVSYGSSIDLVKRLYAVYPEAQGKMNFHSQTPLDIAIHSSRCPEEVTDFLRSVACHVSHTGGMLVNSKKSDLCHSLGCLEDELDDIMQINC